MCVALVVATAIYGFAYLSIILKLPSIVPCKNFESLVSDVM